MATTWGLDMMKAAASDGCNKLQFVKVATNGAYNLWNM